MLSSVAPLVLPSGGLLVEEGAPAGRPLLLLHGVGGGAWSWRAQRAALGRTLRLFVWEARGHGAAPPVADAGLGDYFVDARDGLAEAHARAQAPIVVVGHSMGGLLALALAAEAPALVAGLVLIDPVYATGEETYAHVPPYLARVARVACEPLIASTLRGGRIGRWLGRFVFERAFEDRTRMEEAWRDQQRQQPVEYRRMLVEAFEGPTNFPLRPFAAEIDCPTLLIEGSTGLRSPRFPALVATLAHRLGPRFAREAIRGGHYLQLDRPDAINAALERFAAHLPAR